MKTRIFLCTMGLTAFLFAGCGGQQSRMGYIGAESAKRAALEAASLSEQEVSFVSTDMGTRDGLDYYQVSFEASGQKYQYDIDALTGVVISVENFTAAGAENSAEAENSAGAGNISGAGNTAGAGSSQTGWTQTSGRQAAGNQGSDAYIGEEEARRIALEHAGMEESQVTFVRSRLEFDDGQWGYDVEFYTADYEEYDYEIDAYTGTVISFDFDAEHYAPQSDSSGAITPDQARQLALGQVPGASESDIREFKTDYDDGILQYEGEIIYNGMEYEFEIDAYSGLIREWSAEPVGR